MREGAATQRSKAARKQKLAEPGEGMWGRKACEGIGFCPGLMNDHAGGATLHPRRSLCWRGEA